MKSLLHMLQLCLFVIILLVIQFCVSYIFPFPLSAVHVPTSIVVVYLMVKEQRRIVWYMFSFLFLLEILVPSNFYGSMLIPGVLSTFLVYWFHRFFFTNQSLYTGMILGASMLVCYRFFALVYDLFFSIGIKNTDPQYPAFSFSLFGIEVLATELVILLLLFVLLKRKA
ncbi:MAG: hypothetical protein UY72_C0060G0008 [Candidatus Uhrbacteria bacterium GW2011_GWD2_52_7]|uniref:Rod shape-determining protein MreD n=1 Tax=Candidatus Uhrbacteria bacterium GW2011_GWD2_52_7 TaxID=1618989 RepID=A0A0G2A920_9BACT|nr:MAG: hypothetical protein UY72_C0060G0008 [Candidatus Uhrbacteria bacterium GW2011_GWD2_52_7]